MLSSIIGTLKRVTIGEEGGEKNGNAESESDSEDERINIPTVSSGISTRNVEEKTEKVGTEDDEEEIKVRGIITTVDPETGSGVIDRLYTFKISKLRKPNKMTFYRGDRVDFIAVRSQGRPKWEVISMDLYETHQEETNKESCGHKMVIVKVMSIDSQYIEVETGNPEDRRSLKTIQLQNGPKFNLGFSWLPGDWMKLRLERLESQISDDEFFEQLSSGANDGFFSVAPAQKKTVVGKVTQRNQNKLIDDSIYYTQGISKTMFPIGTAVKCEAISSYQPVGTDEEDFVEWRAVQVQKSNFLHYTGFDRNADNAENWQVDDLGKAAVNFHQELMNDKNGIKITPRYLKFHPLEIGSLSVKTLTIVNSSQQTYRLEKIHFNQDQLVSQFDVQSSRQQADGSVVFLPNDEVIFNVSCRPLMIGKTTEMCVFDFGNFMIARNFIVTGRAEEEKNLVIDTVPYRSNFKKQIGDQDISKIIADRDRKRVRGNQTVRAPFFAQKRLPLNKIPNELFQILKDQDEEKLKVLYPDALTLPITIDNYLQKFQVSLWFEEIENDLRRRQYDLRDVRLIKCSSNPVCYKFQAPGIDEFQPPVNLQDTIDAFDVESKTNAKFQGTIIKINDPEVTCVFGEAFDQQYKGFPLTIQFNLGRSTYKRCHFAVQTAFEFLGENVLFPSENITVKSPRILVYEDDAPECTDEIIEQTKSTSPTSSKNDRKQLSSSSVFRKHTPTAMFNANANGTSSASDETFSEIVIGRRVPSLKSHFVSDTVGAPSSDTVFLKWFNVGLNEEQKNAVRRILRGQARPVPYIIYGPPGTGKTVTLVEAIMQVNKLDINSRILVCAPSNTAADVIAECLVNSKQYNPGDFVRLNGFMRSGQTMLESIAPYCTDGEDLISVAMNRLIISTCVTAGQFFSLDLSIGHFTHVFIDEAGYCTEPETMIPSILLALSKGGQLILAGDPNQLGPVLMSDVSQNIGLNISFLERLMKLPLYRRDQERFPNEKYNPLVLTKLVKNYRAHPTLLKLPSRLFYDDDLESRATHDEAYALCQDSSMKNILVSEGVPLIFHGVQGSCTRERDSPSWCNKAEAIQVVHYVSTLLGKCGLSCEDIGIITPYRKQVEKIRLALQMNLAMKDSELPKVASVEEFQGGERKIIIISTVRSANENRIDSQLERLGFLYQPKRFNVVITRAKALMIVVGNPFVLSKNQYWLKLLRYSLDLNAYKGCNLPIHLNRQVRRLVQFETDEELQNNKENGKMSEEDGSSSVVENRSNVVKEISNVCNIVVNQKQPEDFTDAVDF